VVPPFRGRTGLDIGAHGSQTNFTGWLGLSKKVYLAGGTTSPSWRYVYDLEGFNHRTAGDASHWQNSSNGWNNMPIITKIGSGIDVYNFYDDQSSNDVGELDFTVHADVNSTGLVKPANEAWCSQPCFYDYITGPSISVVATYEPGSGSDVWKSPTAHGPMSISMLGLRNLSAPNLGYAAPTFNEMASTVEGVSWVALGILAGVALDVLFGGLPRVF
jgi:hypothetical protein